MRHHDVPPGLIVLLVACSGESSPPPAKDVPRDARVVVVAPKTIAAIDRAMKPWTGAKPGCAVGVVKHGALAFARGYGMADVAAGVPLTPATVLDLGSTSKQMTAALIHQLVDEGKLRLDDPLTMHVPEVSKQRGRAITIADLLHHTSGLPDYIGLLDAEYVDVTTGGDALAAIAAAKPRRAPGKVFEYSNSGYFLLGLIVERVTGQRLAVVARARLFTPLGMSHTVVGDGGQTPVPGLARGYEREQVVTSGWQQVGDGAVQSTVEDLARWAAVAPTKAQLTPGTLDDGTVLDYASGLYLAEHDGHATISHSGSWVGFGAELLRLPDDDVAVIVLCNFDESAPESYALEIAELVLNERNVE